MDTVEDDVIQHERVFSHAGRRQVKSKEGWGEVVTTTARVCGQKLEVTCQPCVRDCEETREEGFLYSC